MLTMRPSLFLTACPGSGPGHAVQRRALGPAVSAAGPTCRRRAVVERASSAGQDRTYSRTCQRRVCEYVRTSCNHGAGCPHAGRERCGCKQRSSRRQQERDLWGAFARRVRRPAARAGHLAIRRRHQSRSPGSGGVSGARSNADLWGGIERSAKRERGKCRAGFAA